MKAGLEICIGLLSNPQPSFPSFSLDVTNLAEDLAHSQLE